MNELNCLGILAVTLLSLAKLSEGAHFLTIDKAAKRFKHHGQVVFLSGMNQAWNSYAQDFGNHLYAKNKAALEGYLKSIHDAGGNSVRIWLHIEGETSPQFNNDGFVISTDRDGTLISDMREYLQAAYKYNILVFFCLWNGATHHRTTLEGLLKSETKLQSYIDKALIPMVRGLKNEPALGGWDIINEPNNVLIPYQYNSEKCFDTKSFGGGGVGHIYSMQQILKYGHLDFYTVHTYASSGNYQGHAPFLKNAADYKLDKPIVIAEFSQLCGGGMTIQQQFQFAYNHGWSGAWSWHARGPAGSCSDSLQTQQNGLRSIRDNHDQSKGGLVKINLHS